MMKAKNKIREILQSFEIYFYEKTSAKTQFTFIQ